MNETRKSESIFVWATSMRRLALVALFAMLSTATVWAELTFTYVPENGGTCVILNGAYFTVTPNEGYYVVSVMYTGTDQWVGNATTPDSQTECYKANSVNDQITVTFARKPVELAYNYIDDYYIAEVTGFKEGYAPLPDEVVDIPSIVRHNNTDFTVKSILSGAFQNCSSLTSVAIPASVTTIEEYAFCNCSSLTSVTIPNSVTNIGTQAFFGCNKLTSIEIPGSVTTIGFNAFQGCSSLTSVTIPNSVKSMGSYLFSNCNNLSSVTIEDGVTSIEMYAFSRCGNLTSITIPASVTKIGNNVFEGCSSLTSVTIPYGVTVLYSYTFQFCSSLNAVTIPASVRDIHNCVFQGCTGLTSVTIPDGVTSIGSGTFADCTGLKTVTIPASVTSIDFDAFHNCPEVTDVYCYADPVALTWDENGCDDFKDNKGTTCHVFDEAAWTTNFGNSVNLNFVGDLPSTATLTANSANGNYWTTYYCGYTGYQIDDAENACAYTAEVSGNELTLHKLGKVIPAGTAVIIVGEDNSIRMTVSTETATVPANNLHGVDVRTLKSTLDPSNNKSGTFYVMSKKGDDFGFFQYTADYMPAHKAYLLVNGGAAQARSLTMVFGGDETGIVSMSEVRSQKSDVWYTLDGRKLQGKPTAKGLFIHNGMKVAIK